MNETAGAGAPARPRGPVLRGPRPAAAGVARRAARYRLVVWGGTIAAGVAAGVLVGPALDRVSPDAMHVWAMMHPPSTAWPLGTDDLGRDILSRLLAGGRVSLGVGLAAAIAAAGFWRAWVDTTLMRLMDLLFSFPTMALAVAIVGVLGPSLRNAVLAIAVVAMPRFARLVRGQVLALREQDFIEAARAIGVPAGGIIRRHVLPNLLGLIVIEGTLAVSFGILTEASLSFLGLGVQPPAASWGSMLRYGYPFLDQAPWISIVPGLAIMLTILGLNLLGDGIRDLLDPRLRR